MDFHAGELAGDCVGVIMTRDLIQGFIDGHKSAGHDESCLEKCARSWMQTHHTYPQDFESIQKLVGDLGSYKH
jgi:hypothetical protein